MHALSHSHDFLREHATRAAAGAPGQDAAAPAALASCLAWLGPPAGVRVDWPLVHGQLHAAQQKMGVLQVRQGRLPGA